jgi:hypothetical protein
MPTIPDFSGIETSRFIKSSPVSVSTRKNWNLRLLEADSELEGKSRANQKVGRSETVKPSTPFWGYSGTKAVILGQLFRFPALLRPVGAPRLGSLNQKAKGLFCPLIWVEGILRVLVSLTKIGTLVLLAQARSFTSRQFKVKMTRIERVGQGLIMLANIAILLHI